MSIASDPPPRELSVESAARIRADLVAFLARRTRDAALAEDLAQETMVHLLVGLPRFRGAAALRTWARRIAVNVWRDHGRRQSARPAQAAVPGDARAIAASTDARDPSASVEETLDRRATHECLLDAVRQLPLDARRILLLHDFGDMPLADAAAALGCSPGAAKVRLHRARRRLAECCRVECTSEAGADGALLCTPNAAASPLDARAHAPRPMGRVATRRRR